MGENIKTVYAMINGQKVVASYDPETELYTVETSAPAKSSFWEKGHVYTVSLHAEDMAGNTTDMTSDDPTYGSQLKIRVLEKTPPVAAIKKPTASSVLASNNVEFALSYNDEGGSGLNMESIVFTINGADHKNDINWNDNDGTGYVTNLPDGVNTATFQITDNDGNASTLSSISFLIVTGSPSLDIIRPVEGLITNSPTVVIAGMVKPASSYSPITSVTINKQAVDVNPDNGTFNYTYTLSEGENTITILANDTLGHTTQVIRHVTLDTKAPIITDVVAESTVVETSGMIKITFKVTDAIDA